MSEPKRTLLDAVFVIGGVGLSTLFISTDGNGQNSLPVAAGLLFVVMITGLVSFVVARFVHGTPRSIVVSTINTDLLFALYFVSWFAFSKQVHEHGYEELTMVPIVFVVATAPAVVLSSIGFGRFASRFYRRRNLVDDRDA